MNLKMKKMKKIIKYIIIVIMIIPCSCSEEFLDRYPLDQLSSGTFDPDLSLTSVYDALQNEYVSQIFFNLDCITPIGFTRSFLYRNIQNGTHDPFYGSILSVWRKTYQGVFRANDFLERIEEYDMEEAEKNIFIAEVRFLRAFYYSKLTDYWGDVPLILKTLTIEDSRTITRNPKSEVISQILSDLDFAINNLPNASEKAGHATKGAALALKARVNLYESNWQETVNAAQAIMNLGVYELYNTSNSSDYAMIFNWQNENNIEVIFDVQFAGPDLGEGNVFESYLMNKNSIRNGYVWCNPTQYMLDSYETLDGSPIDYSDPDNYSQYNNRDWRLDATIIRHGAIFNEKVWNPGFPGYTKSGSGYVLRKYVMETEDQATVKRWDAPNNFILIRYADVLLIYAEAKNELSGPDQSVYDAINLVRERAGLQPLTAGLAQSGMRDKIRHERMIELAFEGLYYTDIRRWGNAKEYIDNNPPLKNNGNLIETRVFDPGKNYL